MKLKSLWAASPLLMFHFEGPVVWKAIPNKSSEWPSSSHITADLSQKDLEGQLWQKPNGEFSLQIAISFRDQKHQILETNPKGYHDPKGKMKADQSPVTVVFEDGPQKSLQLSCNPLQCVGEWNPLPWDWTIKQRIRIESNLLAKKQKVWTLVLEPSPLNASGFAMEETKIQELPLSSKRTYFQKPLSFADWTNEKWGKSETLGFFEVPQGSRKVFQNLGEAIDLQLCEAGSNLIKTYKIENKAFMTLESKKIFAWRSKGSSLNLREQVEIK